MSLKLRDHILVHDRDMSVNCTGCGEKLRMQLPVNVDVWLVAAAKFAEIHTPCAPKEEPECVVA